MSERPGAMGMMLDLEIRDRAGTLDIDVKWSALSGVAVLAGPNGSGKTTILRGILGIRRPLFSRVMLGGRDVGNLPAEQRQIGYVPQGYALFPHLTCLQNVAFGLLARGRRDATGVRGGAPSSTMRAMDRARAMLATLGVEELAGRSPATLSGGEAQRIALARALAPEPDALLLDEPLAALDVTVRKEVRRRLGETLATLGRPAIVVSHDPIDAAQLGSRVIVVEAGRVTQDAPFARLRAAPATEFVAAFAGVNPG